MKPTPQSTPFDTVVHTCGEQPLPILMGCLSVPARRHLFVCSKTTAPLIPRICREADILPESAKTIEVNPYDIRGISEALLADLKGAGGGVCMNVTGGTKPMSIACLITALNRKWDAYYIDTSDRQIIWLTGDRGREPLRPLFTSIEPFVRLSGEQILPPADTASPHPMEIRRELTCHIARELASPLKKLAVRIIRKKVNEQPGTRFAVKSGQLEASLTSNQVASLSTPLGDFTFKDMPDFAVYLAGGWFEEYCCWQLLDLQQRGEIKDLRLNLRTCNEKGEQGKNSKPYQEIDLIFTNGYDLVLIECKSGSIKQEHIQKLENITNRYGGVFGKGILVSVFPPHYGSFPDRLRSSRNIACICGQAIHKLASHVLAVQPKDFIGGKPRKRKM
jgi:hypothetical protein